MLERLARSGVGPPIGVGAVGVGGIVVARHDHGWAPAVVGIAVVLAVLAASRRSPSLTLSVLGVACAATFAPPGLGPLLVAVGVSVAGNPTRVWTGARMWGVGPLAALVALPALAGLAGVVAAEPSRRAGTIAVAAGVSLLILARRPPLPRASSGQLGVGALIAGAWLALGPQTVPWLGEIPRATVTAARGLAAAVGVVLLVVVVGRVVPARGSRSRPGL